MTRLRPVFILLLALLLPVRAVLAAVLPCLPAGSGSEHLPMPTGAVAYTILAVPVATEASRPAMSAERGPHQSHASHSLDGSFDGAFDELQPVPASAVHSASGSVHHSAPCPHCVVGCCLPPVVGGGSAVLMPAAPAVDLPALRLPFLDDRAEARERPPRRL